MPGNNKKRKGDTKMWGSSPAASGASRRKGERSAARRGASGGGRDGGGRDGGSGGGAAIDEARAAGMFDDLCEPDNPDAASMEGICKLCDRLGIDALEDVRVLVLLWKLGATKRPAELQRSEWLAGCRRLGADSVAAFRALMPTLDPGFLERREFADFYKFCFQFNRAGTHKTLEKDLAVALLRLVLAGGRVAPRRLATFAAFLAGSPDAAHGRVTLDQWRSFLEFGLEYPDAGALEGYDEGESAWPVLIDEYVEHLERGGGDGEA